MFRLQRWYFLSGLLGIILAISSVGTVAAVELRVGGAPESCLHFFGMYKELVAAETGINLVVKPSSSQQGLLELDRGHVDIATTELPLDRLVQDLEATGYPVDAGAFQVQGISSNYVSVYLHKTNRIPELSQEQLHDIFTGRITNWSQVGGDHREIVVIWGDQTPEQNRLFQQLAIGNEPIVKSAEWATDQKDIVERVTKAPGAIGIASSGYRSPRTHSPKTPFVWSKVIAITKGAPNQEIQNVLEIIKTFDN